MLSSRARFASCRGTNRSTVSSTTSLIQSIGYRNGINRDLSSSRPTARSTLGQSVLGSLDGNSLDFGDTEEHDLFSSDANWLSRFTPFDVLSPSALEELVACATEVSISPGQVLVEPSQDSPADEVFIVRRGQAEEQSFGPGIGSEEEGLPLTRQTIVPGCVIGWSEVLANKPYRHKVVSTTLMKLWTIPATYLRQVSVETYSGSLLISSLSHSQLLLISSLSHTQTSHSQPLPLRRISQQPMRRAQYAKSVTRLVARQMEGLEAAIVEEKKNSMARTRALTPYLVPPPKRGVIGNSAYADR